MVAGQQTEKLMDIRKLYKNLNHAQNNIVQSTDVATASLCNYLFKLSYPYGIISGKDDDFVVADTTHEIMSLIAPSILLKTGNTGYYNLSISQCRVSHLFNLTNMPLLSKSPSRNDQDSRGFRTILPTTVFYV